MRTGSGRFALAVVVACVSHAAAARPPIIDVHLHAHTLADYGGGVPVCTSDEPIEFPGVDPRVPVTIEKVELCAHPRSPAKTDDAVMRESLAALERFNIFAVTSGGLAEVTRWRELSPARVIPVGVHLGEGPPGGTHVGGYPTYRVALGSPLQLEPVLIKHPKLRIYVMHYGSPFIDEMIALLYSHPQVFVDIAQNNWGFPRAHFYAQLKRLVDAGFGKRILWGSDQMVWPATIAVAIDTMEKAPFLSAAQKRDIFYDNAARFLRLGADERARHSRGGH